MTNSAGPGSGHTSTDDLFVLSVVGVLALGGLSVAAGWHAVVAWLTTHGVLVPAQRRPLIGVPGTAGAGLDLARLALVAAVLLLLVAVAISAVHRWIRRRREPG